MADGQIDIKEDASPTKELASQTHLHGATTVHAEEIVIVDSAGNLVGQTAGRLNVDGSGVTQPVSDGGGALTVDALDFDIRNLATGQDKVDVRLRNLADAAFIEPAIDRATAAAPTAARLSDGAAFYKATTPTDTQPVSLAAAVTIAKTDLAPAAPTAASVGVASAQAVAANGSRKGLVLVNTSVNRISLGFGATAVLDSGITLYPGGVFNMGEYDFDLGAVNAIASAAASNLAIQEYA